MPFLGVFTMSVKEQVREVAERLPDSATFEDALYALYVRMKFEKGERQITTGEGIPHEEVKQLIDSWRR